MKKIGPLLFFYFIFQCGIAQTPVNDQPAFIRDSLDSYIVKGMQDWTVPGLSIAIIKDNKVIWMKGYGVKDIETKKTP